MPGCNPDGMLVGAPSWAVVLVYQVWYVGAGMLWGSIELEPEVAEWIEALPAAEFGRAEFYIDLLAGRGPVAR